MSPLIRCRNRWQARSRPLLRLSRLSKVALMVESDSPLHRICPLLPTFCLIQSVLTVVKNLPSANAGDTGSTPGLGRSPGGGNGNPLQYSCLLNLTDKGAQWVTVHGVTKELDTTEQACTHTCTYHVVENGKISFFLWLSNNPLYI